MSLSILAIVALLVFTSLTIVNVVGQEPVSYDLEFADPEGDPEYFLITDQGSEEKSDILKVTSTKNGDDIVFTVKIKGLMNLTSSTTYSTTYQFNIDIDGDELYDWLVSSSNMINYNGTNSQLQEDDRGATWTLYYLDNATVIGTDTLSVRFPLSYITILEPVDSWDIYGTSHIVNLGKSATYQDTAPDDGFTGGGGSGLDPAGDEDSDGMPNGWETNNALDPNDASDANEDDDSDGYTNKEEYNAGTDPQDPASHPTEPAGELKIVILKPTAGEEIPPGGVAGDSINLMDFRVIDATVSDWQSVYDDSSASDYSKWYGEIDTYTVEGQNAMMKKGDNTLEVRATTVNGLTTTATVVFKFNPDGGGEVPDDVDKIGQEIATDTSIAVKITNAKWDVDIDGDIVNVNYFVSGTTSGVDHCEFVSVSYYDDGSFDDDVEWTEEFNMDGFEFGGMKLELYHFEASSDNWKTWEYLMKGEMTLEEYNDTDDDGKEVSKLVVYIRAYNDADEKNWNQDSKAISISSAGDSDDDDDDKGSPGFESVIFLGAIAITLVFLTSRRRRR
jgi:hypothetical protein